MANRKSLYIQVYIDTVNALKGIKGLKGAINLLGSALRAVFRTAILAGFFILIRQIFVTIQNLKTSVQQLTSQFSKLRFEGMKSAAVMAKGGEAASEVFSEISEYARRASTQVSYMAQEIHKGLFTAAIAGYELEDSINLSTTAMKLATIAGGDFKQTIGGLISISRAFGVETKKMGAIGEVIANAVSRSKMELADFFTSMKYVAPIATTAFGDGAETILDTSAALMTLQDQGLNASKAGVYLRGSMQKLLGSTSRAVTGFAKYGVNIYEATGESQKFFKTLLSGQKALGGHYDKLNELKQEQFKLALAGKEGSREYEKLTNRINKLNTSMNSLKGGLNDVFEQFTLSGGKLKPFHKVLGELTKMPREVVGKMFGIRGGQALQALLGKPQEFERHRATLNKYFAAYKEGEGILQKMFSKVLDTVAVKFQRIKNLGLAVFGALFDPLLGQRNLY